MGKPAVASQQHTIPRRRRQENNGSYKEKPWTKSLNLLTINNRLPQNISPPWPATRSPKTRAQKLISPSPNIWWATKWEQPLSWPARRRKNSHIFSLCCIIPVMKNPCDICGGSGQLGVFRGLSRFVITWEECPECFGTGLKMDNSDQSEPPSESDTENNSSGDEQ